MKILYLGTGDARGIPQPYCDCEVCQNARARKGKEVRSRSSFLVNEDLMIDFSPDYYYHTFLGGFDPIKVQTLLITHTHSDHFNVQDIILRDESLPKNNRPLLTVYGNAKVQKDLLEAASRTLGFTEVKTLSVGDKITAGDYEVLALHGDHVPFEECLIYLIKQGGKAYFHALDTALLEEETYRLLQAEGVVLDAVSMDCTFGDMEGSFYGHMSLTDAITVKNKLFELGLANESTKFVLTHISHCCGKGYEELSEIAKKQGFILAYDGMRVEI